MVEQEGIIAVTALTVRRSGPVSGFSLLAFFVPEFGRPNADCIAISQEMLCDALGIDVDAILAAPVDDAGRVAVGDNHGVAPAYVRRLELDVVLLRSADREPDYCGGCQDPGPVSRAAKS